MTKQEFYQSKFEYYRVVNMWIVIAASVPSVAYFISDCYLFGYMTTKTLLPRMAILIPLAVFLWANAHTKNYRIIVPLSYIVAHGTMWCTIWACAYLPDLSYACEGFIIIHFIFVALGIVTPLKYGVIAQGLLFVDIIIANTFLHYPEYAMMFLLGVPLYLGSCIYDVAVERTYRDQLEMKLQLENNLKHDGLTGAYNRKIMQTIMEENNISEAANERQMAIIMYDLDYFKHINDTYGHDMGDDMLVKVTEKVQSLLQQDEYLIRWGGEEFIIIMKDGAGEFVNRTEHIRQEVEQITYANDDHITISMGLTYYHGGDYQQAVREADEAMYQAKDSGRNRVITYQGKN